MLESKRAVDAPEMSLIVEQIRTSWSARNTRAFAHSNVHSRVGSRHCAPAFESSPRTGLMVRSDDSVSFDGLTFRYDPVGGGLAVESGTANAQMTRNLGHAAAIMPDRKPDYLLFDLPKPTHITGFGAKADANLPRLVTIEHMRTTRGRLDRASPRPEGPQLGGKQTGSYPR